MQAVPDSSRTPRFHHLLVGGRVVTPRGVLSPGWIRLAGNLIDAVGSARPPAPGSRGGAVTDLCGAWVLPGFVDMHVHGGGGTSFTEGSSDEARRAAEFHRRHGTTTLVASLVTAPMAELEARAAMLAPLAAHGVLAGLHLEGPFLSAARCGAQDPRHLLAPDVAAFERLRAAAGGHLRVVTIAPELDGATELIKAATRAGVTAAIGHTDATAEAASAAIDLGATHATHLFNGMRPLHHREPGAAGALLDRAEVTCEVIVDGVHLHPAVIRMVARAAGPGRLVLITDAMAAAGMPDGDYRLGSLRVNVTGGVARLADRTSATGAGPIAGSTATMAGVVRQAVAAGLPVLDVAAAASTTPARVLGLGNRVGALRPGLEADLVVCDDDFRLSMVMAAGRWLDPAAPDPAGLASLANRPGELPGGRADLAHDRAFACLPGGLVRVDVLLREAGVCESRLEVTTQPGRAAVARVLLHRRVTWPGRRGQGKGGEHLRVVRGSAGQHRDGQPARPRVDALARVELEYGGGPVGDHGLLVEAVGGYRQHAGGDPDQHDDPDDDADDRQRTHVPTRLYLGRLGRLRLQTRLTRLTRFTRFTRRCFTRLRARFTRCRFTRCRPAGLRPRRLSVCGLSGAGVRQLPGREFTLRQRSIYRLPRRALVYPRRRDHPASIVPMTRHGRSRIADLIGRRTQVAMCAR
jgi:N-acetylglucosamine-6-phosphate deacetylase